MIGHASIDERNRAHGGAAGDQTGKEVCIRSWYNANWNVVLRASDEIRLKMAEACEILCRGNLVGYDQFQRNDLYTQLEKAGWDPRKVTTKTETDCSAFITALARIAGVNVARVPMGGGQYNAPVTQTMRKAFTETGKFVALTDSKYTSSDKYLYRGDILLRESGHTALNLTDGAGVQPKMVVKDKSVNDLAREVLDGKWGNGAEREKLLTAAGYDYDVIQAAVNKLVKRGPQNNELLAMEVLAGQWGNAPDRERLLTEAGYDAKAVQDAVNEIIKRGWSGNG